MQFKVKQVDGDKNALMAFLFDPAGHLSAIVHIDTFLEADGSGGEAYHRLMDGKEVMLNVTLAEDD